MGSKVVSIRLKDAAFHVHDKILLNANLQCHLNPAATCHFKPQIDVSAKRNEDPTVLSGLCSDPSLMQD